MMHRTIHAEDLEAFRLYLVEEEKSPVTVEKYLRDARGFWRFAQGEPVTKELTLAYKTQLQERQYAMRSINSMLASVNSLLAFLKLPECRVKTLRCQRRTYCPEDQQLSKAEYLRLLDASQGNRRLNLILQTICATGIRVSELRYFTVEAVRRGEVTVRCKSKTRTILIPGRLKRTLLEYARRQGRKAGLIFCTKTGNPMDRSNIWSLMKGLCAKAGVAASKVFPHNLRKLFARTFYQAEKDIAKLADLLGHGSIETTRIYIMSTGAEHRRKLERLGLLL